MSEITTEAQKDTSRALEILDQTASISIVTLQDYEGAAGLMKKVKARIREIEEIRKGQTRPLDESKRAIMDFFREPIKRLSDAKAKLNTVMVTWADEQEAARRKEEARLQEEARRKAEIENVKKEIEAEEAGDPEPVEEITVPAVKVASTVPKSRGSHIRETWSAQVASLRELITAIVAGKVPLQAVVPDMAFLNGQARLLKDDLDIPGVQAVSKKTQV